MDRARSRRGGCTSARLSLAPLSVVQAVLSGGLVFLAVLAERYFGFHLGRRQWVGVTITAAGLAVIGLTGGGATPLQHSSLAALIAVESASSRSAPRSSAISTQRGGPHRAEGLLLGWPPGCCSASPTSRSSTSPRRPKAAARARQPWTLTALVAAVIAFYASARSLQFGAGVAVIAFTSVAANLAAIVGGILVFREPIGSGPLAIGARVLAFCLVIAGAALMPAPLRATPERGQHTPSRATSQSDPA